MSALTPYTSSCHDDIDFQLVPPGIHRRNAAERAIRTFKNHFIAGLCSVDKHSPLHLWDRLLPQAVLTLNLLRGSRLNPRLSAWAQLHGTFDFNRTPIAPPGIRVLVHEKPPTRTTWSPHAADGWYTGPALDSYRCFTVWTWSTRANASPTPSHGSPPKSPCRLPRPTISFLPASPISSLPSTIHHPIHRSPHSPTVMCCPPPTHSTLLTRSRRSPPCCATSEGTVPTIRSPAPTLTTRVPLHPTSQPPTPCPTRRAAPCATLARSRRTRHLPNSTGPAHVDAVSIAPRSSRADTAPHPPATRHPTACHPYQHHVP